MNLFNSIQDIQEKLVYVTYNDGIICEIERLENGEEIILYRKRHLKFDEMNKAIMSRILTFVFVYR